MFTQIYYVLRSKLDGKYLVARIDNDDGKQANYLLIFQENFEALTYLNTHASEYCDRFAIESITNSQLKGIMQRWGFIGVGLVEDPIIPRIQFKHQ